MAVAVVVLVFEVADDHPGLGRGVPVVAVEALLPESVVERFDVAVVPRRPWRNVTQPESPAPLWNPRGYQNNAWAHVKVSATRGIRDPMERLADNLRKVPGVAEPTARALRSR